MRRTQCDDNGIRGEWDYVMKRECAALSSIALSVALLGCGAAPPAAPAPRGQAEQAQPYAGARARAIKALAPERVDELLAGRGAGYALAAELNGYPGPRHVLELARQLALSPEQERVASDLAAIMEQQARALGTQLVELEAQLNRTFAGGTTTQEELARLTADIGTLEGRLRAVHLGTHLTMRDALSPHQRAQYDSLRGYSGHVGHAGMVGGTRTGAPRHEPAPR